MHIIIICNYNGGVISRNDIIFLLNQTWEKCLGRCNSVLKSCDIKEAEIEPGEEKLSKEDVDGENLIP